MDRLTHCLQTATLAQRDGRDEEYVVCALLHDIGDTLGSYNHPDIAAAILAPFVSEENRWMVAYHRVFQGYYLFHYLGMDRDLRDAFRDHPVGSGPFRFVSADANEIRLQANPACAYAQPKIENVAFKIVREDNTRFLKVMKGELDLVQQELPPSKVVELEKKGGFHIHKYPGLSMAYLLVNLKDSTFQSKEARQALSLALNREEIIRFKLEGLAQPATSILSPINPYHDGSLVAPQFDLEQAKKLIKAAGLEGKEIVLKTSNATQAVENGKVLANQLEAAGLKVKLQSFEWATFYKDMDQGNFQLATIKWGSASTPSRSLPRVKAVWPRPMMGSLQNA